MQEEAYNVYKHAQKQRGENKTHTESKSKTKKGEGLWLLEEGEYTSWQHLRIIYSNWSMSLSE